MTVHDKTYRYYLKITIIPMFVFVLLAIVVWQCGLGSLENKQRTEASDIIQSVVQQQVEKNLLLPRIVFIDSDSSRKNDLTKKMISDISSVLLKQYLAEGTTDFNSLEIKPFFVLPDKPNNSGTYSLTESQISDLKNHLIFLTKQVDNELDKAKEEVSRDIDRLNLWVTIWIGVIGFLGIFIPIIINIDTSKSTEKAVEKSESAYTKADAAISSANEAVKKAHSAKSKSDALHLVYAINKLDNLEPENIKYVERNKWIPLVKKILLSIKQSLDECKIQHDGDIVKESLSKMLIGLSRISFQKFLQSENTERITKYIQSVDEILKTKYNQQNFERILLGLEDLAKNLKDE